MLKTIMRNLLPDAAVAAYHRRRRARLRERNRTLSAKEVFTKIYQDNEWLGPAGGFDSGYGSRPAMTEPYSLAVRKFITENHVSSVVDFGCGDFRVGAQLQMSGLKYLGVDIVEELIAHNQQRFSTPETAFQCLDVIADDVPPADLCLIRQVLQHLSNAQIIAILPKLKRYRYALITEHYPAPSVVAVPNLDKPHGSDIRIFDNSGVYLSQPPFGLKDLSVLLEVEADKFLVAPGEKIVTFLWENKQPAREHYD